MQKIAKNYLYNLIYQVLVLLTPLLMTPYISRALGAEKLGVYDYANSIVTVILTFSLLGIGHYGSREIAYVRDDKKKLTDTFWNILFTQMVLGLLSVVIVIATSFLIDYQTYILLFGIWVLGTIVDCTWIYVGLEDMQHAVLKNIIAKFLFIVATFLFVKTESDLGLYILLNGLSILLANLLAYYNLKDYITRPTIHLGQMKEHLLASVKLFLPLVATQILLSVNKIILGQFTQDIANVSYYGNAEKIIQIPLSLVTVMNTVMMPRIANAFYNQDKEGLKKYLQLSAEFSLFLSFPLMVGIFVVADTFVPWFLGEQFIETALIIKLLCPVILFNTLLGISGNQYFIATNKIKVLFVSNTLVASLAIVLDFLLIPQWGVLGVCLATVLSTGVGLFYQYWCMAKEFTISFMIRPLVRYALQSLAMGGVLVALFPHPSSSVLQTSKQIVLGVIVYFVFSLLTKDPIMVHCYQTLLSRRKRKKEE